MGYRPDMRRPGPKGAANDFLSARHIGWEPGCRISPVPDQRRFVEEEERCQLQIERDSAHGNVSI
jgi:hypothetical protein